MVGESFVVPAHEGEVDQRLRQEGPLVVEKRGKELPEVLRIALERQANG